MRGNINDDEEELDVLDLTYLVDYIFKSGSDPLCPFEADVNGDGRMGNVIDLVFLVNNLYRDGAQPPVCP